MSTAVNTARVQLYANIGGVAVDVSMFQCNYGMNSVPTGTLLLAAGRSMRDPSQISNAHAVLSDVSFQTPVEVYLSYRTLNKQSNYSLTPDGDYLMFRGWATGCGYRRMYNQFGLAVDLTHWLSALTFSSMLGEGIHPGNPFQMSFPAVMQSPADMTSFSLFGHDLAWAFGDATRLEKDFWGEALYPWLYSLAATEHLNFTDLALQIGRIDDSGIIRWALSQFRGGPLCMNLSGSAGGAAALAISQQMSQMSLSPSGEFSGLANTTFWDKLIGELGPTFMFSIIPYPSMARVVPFIPGLQSYWDPWGVGYTFPARDSAGVTISAVMPRTIRAVGLLAGNGSNTGASRDPGGVNFHQLGGWYDSRRQGMIMIRQAPSFLADAPVSSQSIYSTGIWDGLKSNAFAHPGAGGYPPLPFRWTPPDYIQANQGLLDRLAQSLYASEMLQHRVGTFYGPLRFDVSPGSTVKFEAPIGDYTADFLPRGQAFHATVTGVSYMLDANSSRAGTGYQLAHVRTEAENQSSDTSVAQHPLYYNWWVGDLFTGS